MAVNRGVVEAYSMQIRKAQRDAGRKSRRLVAAWIEANTPWAASALRAESARIVHEVVTEYGEYVASLACDLYDECMAGEGFECQMAEMWSGDVSEKVVAAVRYQLRKALDGDVNGYLDAIDEMTQYYVNMFANETTIHNVERDNTAAMVGGARPEYENEVGRGIDMPTSFGDTRRHVQRRRGERKGRKAGDIAYARIPTGAETCTYCMMLASRGAVDYSAQSAGHADHRGCNCMIVAGRYGSPVSDGIDEGAQYQCWRELEELEAYAAQHPDEMNADELEQRKADIVGSYDNITLSDEPGEVRKHVASKNPLSYTPRARMAANYRSSE